MTERPRAWAEQVRRYGIHPVTKGTIFLGEETVRSARCPLCLASHSRGKGITSDFQGVNALGWVFACTKHFAPYMFVAEPPAEPLP